MKKLILGLIMMTVIAVMPSITFAQASANKQVGDEIIAMVKAQWASEIANPKPGVAEKNKNNADDYTEFNEDFATRLEGKTLVTRVGDVDGKDASPVISAEMINPKVQVYGDVAILSYNYSAITKNKEGVKKTIRAKSTRVYAKQSGKWKLVHANFGADPMPN